MKEKSLVGNYKTADLDQKQKNLKGLPNTVLVPFRWRGRVGRAYSLLESFYHAFNGIRIGFQHERNVRIHFLAAGFVCIAAVLLKVDTNGCLALTQSIGLVLTVEFINTSLEHMVDLASGHTFHRSAKAAKDTAAAAVLIASCCALYIGFCVFAPKLISLVPLAK